jgi:hypothetical protein
LSNTKIIDYIKDVVMMGTTDIHQLQIPVNGYYRGSEKGEFSVGDCLIMTDGVNSTLVTTENAEALNSFIFDYDGKEAFTYGTFVNQE